MTDRMEEILDYFNLGVPHQEMANLMGIKVSTVVRKLYTLRNLGEIDTIHPELVEEAEVDDFEGAEEKNRIPRKLSDLEEANQLIQKRTIVVTGAQNNSTIHRGFLSTLESYCDANDAQLVIGQLLYIHPAEEEVNFDPLGIKYYCNQRLNPTKDLQIMTDINIRATSKLPVNAVARMTKGKNTVVCHTKRQNKGIPSPSHVETNHIFSTGVCTLPHYIQQITGQSAEFHHVIGAVVIDIDEDGTIFMRHITANDEGDFYDIDRHYYPDGTIETNEEIFAVGIGDSHVEKLDKPLDVQIKSLLRSFKVGAALLNDVFDAESCSPHVYSVSDMIVKNTLCVESEMRNALDYINSFCELVDNVIVVPSNHDEMIDRWLAKDNWRTSGRNAKIFLELALLKVKGILAKQDRDVFSSWCLEAGTKANFPTIDETLMVGKYLVLHGHKGVNGSRGSSHVYRQACAHIMKFHSHTPESIDGVVGAGHVSQPLHGYNNAGLGTWAQSIILVYNDQHAQNLIVRSDRLLPARFAHLLGNNSIKGENNDT